MDVFPEVSVIDASPEALVVISNHGPFSTILSILPALDIVMTDATEISRDFCGAEKRTVARATPTIRKTR